MATAPIDSFQSITATVVRNDLGYIDYDIAGHPTIHRACVPDSIRVGDHFNVYHNGGKSGCLWVGEIVRSLLKFTA